MDMSRYLEIIKRAEMDFFNQWMPKVREYEATMGTIEPNGNEKNWRIMLKKLQKSKKTER